MYRKKNILHKILLAYDKDFVSAHKYYILINIKVCPKHNKKKHKNTQNNIQKTAILQFNFFIIKLFIVRKVGGRNKMK